jgi:hypothetical protein
MTENATSYHSPKLEARRIDGKGGRTLVVREPVEPGELVVVWGGEVVHASQLGTLSPAQRLLTIQVEEDLYLVSAHVGPADWGNRSWGPDCGLRTDRASSRCAGRARQEVCLTTP